MYDNYIQANFMGDIQDEYKCGFIENISLYDNYI